MVERSFKGIGDFDEKGVLNNTQFTVFRYDGSGFSFTKMIDGRPAEGSYATYFKSEGELQQIFD
jgi:hypothetical protein